MRHHVILHGLRQTAARSSVFLLPGEETRVELRSPDPAANPYLALAVCLAAGIDGIRNKIEPPEEVPENVYELKEKEKSKQRNRVASGRSSCGHL